MADKKNPLKDKVVKIDKVGVLARLAARKAVRGFGKLFGRGRGATGKKVEPKGRGKKRVIGVEDWIDNGEWVRVKSSNVAGIKYDFRQNQLYVEFLGGAIYLYSGVPIAKARLMFLANSMGKFVWRALRGRHPYKRLN